VPTITSLKQQKRKNRVNVYLDGKFGFGIDLESLVIFDLKVGRRMSQKNIDEVIRKAELQKTYDKLLRFATIRPRSEKEINDWLKRKKIHESMYENLFIRLKRLELIDDEKFARWWIDQRNSFRPRSKRVLVQELRLKGIDKDVIENALSEYEINEDVIAKRLYKKNMYKWERLPEFERKQKASSYLARKGFGWDVIKKVVN
jgi:regulatory protein